MSERFGHLAVVEDDQPANIAESFERIDLAAVLAGDLKQPEPTMLYRTGDGIRSALLYTGMVNGIHGDSGTGKSWISIAAMAERFHAAENVMLLDLEDTPESVLSRLIMVGITHDQIVQHLDYRRPTEPFGPFEMADLLATIETDNVSLVVIDSLGEAFGTEGINEDKDAEVGPWLRRVARPLANAGPAVLLIDHSTKSKDGQQLHPSGSKRKRAAIGGASYLIEAVTPFVKGGDGRLRVILAKDRHGTYRRGEHVAWLDMNTAFDGTVTLELVAPAQIEETPQSEILETQILKQLRERGPLSRNMLLSAVRDAGARTGTTPFSDAVNIMVLKGDVLESSGPRGAKVIAVNDRAVAA
jgi:hypothetical protein